MKKLLTFFTLFALMGGITLMAQTLKADNTLSTLDWTGKKISGTHTGTIKLKEGSITIEKNKITKGRFVIDMTTIANSDLQGQWKEKLEGHLRSEDFFEIDTYPAAILEVTSSGEFKDGVADVKGTLTIKGMTHPADFKVNRKEMSFMASVKVDRTLYDIRYGSGKFFSNLGDNMIDDFFTLDVKVVTKKQ